MNYKFLLILSLLSPILALINSTERNESNSKCNFTDCLSSGKVSLFPNYIPLLLTNKSDNASLYSRDWNIIYGNSSTMQMISTEEKIKLLNLTSNKYNSDEIPVIMAFPFSYFNASSLEINESISQHINDANNQIISDVQVRDGQNFSGRTIDLTQLLATFFPRSPIIPFNHKSPVLPTHEPYPPTYAYTTTAHTYENPHQIPEKVPHHVSMPVEPVVKPPKLEVSFN